VETTFSPCRARTIFEGELVDDHIAGTFTSRRDADSIPVTGSWFANRPPKSSIASFPEP
jgi:hypothetical protein